MRVFVTGASGFIGSAVVDELLSAGHDVLGMVRSENSANKLVKFGAQPHYGDLYDFDTIKAGASVCDAVIHTARNRNFSNYKEHCENDRHVIEALASALQGTSKPLVVTSGVGLMNDFGRIVTEEDKPKSSSDVIPRMATEEAAQAAATAGIDAYIVRLAPTVHGHGDKGFIPLLIDIAKEKGVSAYIGEGNNHWPAVNRLDAAALYRLIIEIHPELKILHAVAEEGYMFRDIAMTIGKGLNVPIISKSKEEAAVHFGSFNYAGLDCQVASAKTCEATGWKPTHPGLFEDLLAGGYFD